LTVIGANPALHTIVVSLCKRYRWRDGWLRPLSDEEK